MKSVAREPDSLYRRRMDEIEELPESATWVVVEGLDGGEDVVVFNDGSHCAARLFAE